MESSDEDFLPDPEERRTKPPDRGCTGDDEPDNKQRGLNLHDDSSKGRCFFLFLSELD